MANFSCLPNELVLMVLNRLSPSDADVFCMLSKDIRKVAASFLKEHTDLKRKYTKCRYISDSAVYDNPNGPPADLLMDIIQNPNSALYVRSLHLEGIQYGGANYMTKESAVKLFNAAIRSCAMISGDEEQDQWCESIMTGEEDAVVALLLLMLPNLVTLRLDNCDGHLISHTLARISSSGDKVALTQLSAVQFGQGFNDRIFDYDGILPSLTLLPAVKRISALNVGNPFIQQDVYPQARRPGAKSPVTHLSFTNCCYHPMVLSRVMQGLENLTIFSYCSEVALSHAEPEPSWLRDTLLAHAKDTLRELTIYSWKDGFMGSLKEFTVLVKVSTSARLLQDPSSHIEPALSQTLPRQLTILKLCDHDDLGHLYYFKLLEHLLSIRGEETLELTTLYFLLKADEATSPFARETLRHYLQKKCTTAGMMIVLEWGNSRIEQVFEILEGPGWSGMS